MKAGFDSHRRFRWKARRPRVTADPRHPLFVLRAIWVTAWGLAVSKAESSRIRSENPPRVVYHQFSFGGLPRDLEGLTVAHLSDLHVGFWTPSGEVARVLAMTRDLRPDLVVITGDLVDHTPAFSQTLVRHLPLLEKAPLGVFGTIGNHDVHTSADRVTAAMEAAGVKMLRNRSHPFGDEGLPLSLVGVDDSAENWAGPDPRLHLAEAIGPADDDDFRILLTHRPTGFEAAQAHRIPLTLCGHTHGGQFAVPGGPNLAAFAFRHTHGPYRENGSTLHVSAGLGVAGLPFRLGAPPEIALLKLVSAGTAGPPGNGINTP